MQGRGNILAESSQGMVNKSAVKVSVVSDSLWRERAPEIQLANSGLPFAACKDAEIYLRGRVRRFRGR